VLPKVLLQALRRLGKQPGVTLVMVLTFALGSGINTAIFSLVEALLLRPLPYAQPGRLLAIWPSRVFSPEQFIFLRDRCREIALPAAVSSGWDFSLTGKEQAEQISGSKVTGDFFSLLGVPPLLGRSLTRAEDRPGAPPVAVLSYQLWQRHFSSDPQVVNRTVTLDGTTFTVVGVMPRSFRYLQDLTDVWVPLVLDPADTSFRSENALVIARLSPGSTLARAQGEVRRLAESMRRELHSPEDLDKETSAVPLQEQITKNIQPKLLLLLAGVGLVLLIACANVASLLLALAVSRQREISLRVALGASQAQIMRLLLVESLVLALAGSTVGLLFAYGGLQALTSRLPANTPRLAEIGIDGVALGYSVLIAVLAGLLAGLAPALTGRRLDLNRMLGEGGQRSSEGRVSQRLRRLLAIAEIALAVVLVICAGLVSESFWRLASVNPGFRTDHILSFSLTASPARYIQPSQRRELYHQVLDRLRALPEVRSAGAIQHLPLGGFFWNATMEIEHRPVTAGRPQPGASWRLVTPDYLRTMGIPVLRGRAFNDADREGATNVVLINNTLSRRLWPDGDPIGQRIKAGRATAKNWATIVGVVGDVRHDGLNAEVKSEIYRPFDQQPLLNMTIVVRTTSADPRRLAAGVHRIISSIDSDLPVAKIQTLQNVVDQSIAQQRLMMNLFQIFAVIALGLGTIGIYGVMSYNVSRRVHEIGVRVVLGASRFEVQWLFLRDGAMVVTSGLALGLLASLWATRLLHSLLFGTSATDGWTFVLVALLVSATGFLASFLPARRATRITPREALSD
jgi:putative ABC transport system permease protein